MLTNSKIYANTARYFVQSKLHERGMTVPIIGKKAVGTVDEERVDQILSQYKDSTVFVHAGLSDIKSAFRKDPYQFLLEKLDAHFENILAPGFTPSFRDTGIYHKEFSRPEYGMFSRLFLNDADYRTDDAIHSILVRGDYRFEDCNHHDTFSKDGCWAKLDRDNILYLNIGTPWIIATQHHFIECVNELPYNNKTQHEGVMYLNETNYTEITQTNYRYATPSKRNAKKVQHYLENEQVLDSYSHNGLNILAFNAGDMRTALEKKLANDPYYLIT